jgi:hypothetical protein
MTRQLASCPAVGCRVWALRPPLPRVRRGCSAPDGLDLQELAEAEAAHLAAVARLLLPAEGGEQVHLGAVDVDLAGASGVSGRAVRRGSSAVAVEDGHGRRAGRRRSHGGPPGSTRPATQRVCRGGGACD